MAKRKVRYGVLHNIEFPMDAKQEISVVDAMNFCRRMIRRHGRGLRLRFDAGYNNVGVDVLKPLAKGRRL